ncbi:phosphotransferase family protein [Aeromicrobium sp. CTD01-1L150]|uniref:phosphotransferase family protein n=1 Tax=Aeromicrobium sp. CTD01-1L150 TaxID=3341830 RepID=UPI0035C0752A
MTTSTDLIDTRAVGGWIAGLDLDVQGELTFRRIGAGQSNLTFLVEDGSGRRWILRRPPLGKLLASAHDVEREHRILSALQDTDVPTPVIHGLTTDPAVTDAPIMLMDFVPGHVIDSMASVEELDPEHRGRIGTSLARTLGRIHAVDLDETGLTTLASHKPYAQRQLRRWHRQWGESRTRDLPLVDDLARRLADRVPEQTELRLVHGDFHLMNVITHAEHGDVVAVIDWELSTLGDPLADLGGLLAYWPQADDEHVTGFAGPTLPGFPDRESLVATYAETTGRDVSAVDYWHVLGLWKIAIICEGVLRRALDEPRNTAVTGTADASIVEHLLQRADREAREGGW